MVNLADFLRSGELGPIRFGMSEADVTGILGPPPRWGGSPETPYQAYGGLHLAFRRFDSEPVARLVHIGLYFDPIKGDLPEKIRPTDWLPTTETTAAEFQDYLRCNSLTERRPIKNQSSYHLFLNSGATINFADDRLYSVDFAAPRTPTKQVSISVSEETFAALREQARNENRSIAALCAEWVSERVGSLK